MQEGFSSRVCNTWRNPQSSHMSAVELKYLDHSCHVTIAGHSIKNSLGRLSTTCHNLQSILSCLRSAQHPEREDPLSESHARTRYTVGAPPSSENRVGLRMLEGLTRYGCENDDCSRRKKTCPCYAEIISKSPAQNDMASDGRIPAARHHATRNGRGFFTFRVFPSRSTLFCFLFTTFPAKRPWSCVSFD